MPVTGGPTTNGIGRSLPQQPQQPAGAGNIDENLDVSNFFPGHGMYTGREGVGGVRSVKEGISICCPVF